MPVPHHLEPFAERCKALLFDQSRFSDWLLTVDSVSLFIDLVVFAYPYVRYAHTAGVRPILPSHSVVVSGNLGHLVATPAKREKCVAHIKKTISST